MHINNALAEIVKVDITYMLGEKYRKHAFLDHNRIPGVFTLTLS